MKYSLNFSMTIDVGNITAAANSMAGVMAAINQYGTVNDVRLNKEYDFPSYPSNCALMPETTEPQTVTPTMAT